MSAYVVWPHQSLAFIAFIYSSVYLSNFAASSTNVLRETQKRGYLNMHAYQTIVFVKL